LLTKIGKKFPAVTNTCSRVFYDVFLEIIQGDELDEPPVGDCTENYRHVLSPERTPPMKKQEIVRLMKTKNLVMGHKRGTRHQDELGD
jgi:hypothetical protein